VKYLAMITFGHSGVTITGGSVFDSEDVNFKHQDIDFLKSTGKIMPVQNKEEVLKNKKLAEEKIEIQVDEVLEDVDVALKEVEILKPDSGVDVGESLNEEVGPEGEEGEFEKNEELVTTTDYKLMLEKDDNIKVVIKESDLLKLRKEELINLAIKNGVDPTGKTKLVLAHEIAEVNE